MELVIQNVGIINKITIQLRGLTVVCGSNNSGKSTAGKALYSAIESLSNLEEKLHDELVTNYRRALVSVSRMLDLDSVSKYVDFDRMHEELQRDFSMLLQSPYQYRRPIEHLNAVDSYIALKDAVELLSPDLLFEFAKKSKSDLPKKFFAYLNNFQENKEKALSFLSGLNKYYYNEDRQEFAEKSVASLFSTEFNGQVYPVNLKSKERKSTITMTKNGEIGCSFSVIEKKGIVASVSNDKLFVNNAIYIEDPYALDKMSGDDEVPYMFRYNRVDYSHGAKLRRLLLNRNSDSLIEQSINKEKYDDIVSKISEIIPGVLTIRETGMYYEEPDKEPLRVQNLATGSKMFSIIKNLLEKGEINFDTMLILDEPEAHLHPEWQNVFAEIIVLLVKELDTHVMLTTHSPNFLMALEAYSKKYELLDKANYYMVQHNEDNYTVDYVCVNDQLGRIYSSFTKPLIKVKQLKDN